MGNMVLGSYTFDSNPGNMPIIQEALAVAYQTTWGGVAVFSWDATYAGVKLTLEWDFMTTSQYDSLMTIYKAGAAVVWDPQDGGGKTFQVMVLDLAGEYHLYFENAVGNYRKNVKLTLLILSEAST